MFGLQSFLGGVGGGGMGIGGGGDPMGLPQNTSSTSTGGTIGGGDSITPGGLATASGSRGLSINFAARGAKAEQRDENVNEPTGFKLSPGVVVTLGLLALIAVLVLRR